MSYDNTHDVAQMLSELAGEKSHHKEKIGMNKRTRTLWVPGLISLTLSMAWRLNLQGTVAPSQELLNHAGLPLRQQLLWLAALPLLGAVSAYTSRRAGGDRSTAAIAAVFPAAVMIPFWIVLGMNMSLPSPSQWFGLFSGVVNWIVLPGMTLLLGALPFLKAQPVIDWKVSMNTRTATFWLPALISLTAAMMCLTASTFVGMQLRFVARGLGAFVIYVPWLLMLPLCGAAGARLSRRAGGSRLACLAAGLFPVIAGTALVGFLTLIGDFVFAEPRWLHFSSAFLLGAILPGIALLAGAVQGATVSRLQTEMPSSA